MNSFKLSLPGRRGLCGLVLAIWICCGSGLSAEIPKRFVALLENGETIQGDTLRNWYSDNALPQLAGRDLLSGGNPMRWIIDTAVSPPSRPRSYVELANGDRLPGDVLTHQNESIDRLVVVPEHFQVASSAMLQKSANADFQSDIRIRRDFVRKIVWQRQSQLVDRYLPGTLIFRNGRQLPYRGIRYVESSVQVLTDDGRQTVSFGEIAELHLPETDPWQLYVKELAILFAGDPFRESGRERLVQWETQDGVVATTSLNRMDADARGNNNESDRWLHGIQPAWSLDILWLASKDTWSRRSWRADQLPLIRLVPQEDRSGAYFSHQGFAARVNRNVLGREARDFERPIGWNFGVMAPSKLSFDIGPYCIGLETHIGLDHAAGEGGCIRALVHLSNRSQPIYRSDVLVGSAKQVLRPGTMSWNTGDISPDTRLILEIDPAHEDRPEGADPYDIRDLTNWIEPRLLLDRDALRERVQAAAPELMLAWKGWQFESEDEEGTIEFHDSSRRVDYEPGSWRTTVVAQEKPLRLTRSMKITPENQILEIATAKFGDFGKEPQIEIRVNGFPIAQETIESSNKHDRGGSPILASLAPFMDQEVEVTITQGPSDPRAPIDWRAIRFSPSSRNLVTVLEDPSEEDVETLAVASEIDAEKIVRHAGHEMVGRPAIEIGPEVWVRLASFDPPLEIRERTHPDQLRHIRFAFKKRGQGLVAIRIRHLEEEERPAVMVIGPGEMPIEDAHRLDGAGLNEEWRTVTRDLVQEFRDMDVTGIEVWSTGEGALWDHFYLGRSSRDLERIPAPAPERSNWENWLTRAEQIQTQLNQSMVQVKAANAPSIPGIMVDGGQRVLALAAIHGIERDQAIEVTGHDGVQVSAKVLGIDHTAGLALARIEDTDESKEALSKWSHLNLTGASEFERHQMLLLVQPDQEAKPPTEDEQEDQDEEAPFEMPRHWDTVHIQAGSPGRAMVKIPSYDVQPGAIAIDHNHQVIGFVVDKVGNGYPVVQSAHPLRQHWDKLLRGEDHTEP